MALFVIGKQGAFNNKVFESQAGILQEHIYIRFVCFASVSDCCCSADSPATAGRTGAHHAPQGSFTFSCCGERAPLLQEFLGNFNLNDQQKALVGALGLPSISASEQATAPDAGDKQPSTSAGVTSMEATAWTTKLRAAGFDVGNQCVNRKSGGSTYKICIIGESSVRLQEVKHCEEVGDAIDVDVKTFLATFAKVKTVQKIEWVGNAPELRCSDDGP
jgi:hypothetical protein